MEIKRGAPMIREDVERNSTGDGADVWVVDLRDELHLGRFKGIVGGHDDVL